MSTFQAFTQTLTIDTQTGASVMVAFPPVPVGQEWDVIHCSIFAYDEQDQFIYPLNNPDVAVFPNPVLCVGLAPTKVSAALGNFKEPKDEEIRHIFVPYLSSKGRLFAGFHGWLPIPIPAGSQAFVWSRFAIVGIANLTTITATILFMQRDAEKEPYLTVTIPGEHS